MGLYPPNKNTSKNTLPMQVTDISRGCLQYPFFMIITQNIEMGTGRATTNSESVGIQVSTFVYLAFQIALEPRHDRGPSLYTSQQVPPTELQSPVEIFSAWCCEESCYQDPAAKSCASYTFVDIEPPGELTVPVSWSSSQDSSSVDEAEVLELFAFLKKL